MSANQWLIGSVLLPIHPFLIIFFNSSQCPQNNGLLYNQSMIRIFKLIGLIIHTCAVGILLCIVAYHLITPNRTSGSSQ